MFHIKLKANLFFLSLLSSSPFMVYICFLTSSVTCACQFVFHKDKAYLIMVFSKGCNLSCYSGESELSISSCHFPVLVSTVMYITFDYPRTSWACSEGPGSVLFISTSEKGQLKFNGESFLLYPHHSPFSFLSFIPFLPVSPSLLFA
jgi:hypothetical protein